MQPQRSRWQTVSDSRDVPYKQVIPGGRRFGGKWGWLSADAVSSLDRRGRLQAGRWEPVRGPFSVASSTRIRVLQRPGSQAAAAGDEAQVLRQTQDNEEMSSGSRRWISARPRWCRLRVSMRTIRAGGCRSGELLRDRSLPSMADHLACLG